MQKTLIIIAILAITTLGGIILNKNISDVKGNKFSIVLDSLNSQQLYKAELSIEGMWCVSCAVGAEYNLKAIEGVVDVYVGFTDNLDGEGWVVYQNGKVSEEQIVKAVEPYKATIVSNALYTE